MSTPFSNHFKLNLANLAPDSLSYNKKIFPSLDVPGFPAIIEE